MTRENLEKAEKVMPKIKDAEKFLSAVLVEQWKELCKELKRMK